MGYYIYYFYSTHTRRVRRDYAPSNVVLSTSSAQSWVLWRAGGRCGAECGADSVLSRERARSACVVFCLFRDCAADGYCAAEQAAPARRYEIWEMGILKDVIMHNDELISHSSVRNNGRVCSCFSCECNYYVISVCFHQSF